MRRFTLIDYMNQNICRVYLREQKNKRREKISLQKNKRYNTIKRKSKECFMNALIDIFMCLVFFNKLHIQMMMIELNYIINYNVAT